MKSNNINERIAELSATLSSIQHALTFGQASEVMGIAEDYISYNSPCYYNGLQRVDYLDTIASCIFEKAGEYQVLRYFATDVYDDGEGMYQYYANELANRDNDNYMDDGEYDNYMDDGEYDNYMDDGEYDNNFQMEKPVEYKQVWIDSKGNTTTIILDEEIQCKGEVFCSVLSKQEWFSNPKITYYLISSIKEYDDYCYTYPDEGDIVLKDLRKSFIQSARKFNAEFVDEIVEHSFTDEFIRYYRTFMVLAKHHIALPHGYEDMRIYFRQLANLEHDGICLTEPRYINPAQLIANYREEQDRLAQEREEKAKQLAQQEEARFNREHAYLFNIEFDNDHFHFKSLDSVEAYRIEGEIMHHCIFRSKYYNQHNVLSMHITDMEGNRVATCSINVEEGTIIQLQTICNNAQWREGDEYKEIWNVLMARMHTFPKYKPQQTIKLIKVA